MSEEFFKQIHEKYKNRVICISSPLPEKTDYRYNISLIEHLAQNINLFQMRLNHQVSARISMNRNKIIESARQMGCTDILWVDGDTKFPAYGMLKLLEHGKDIVGATTCMRDGHGMPVGTAMEPVEQVSLIKMVLLGFPFMLTSMRVFDKMDELWPERKGCYFAEPPRWAFPQFGTVKDGLIGEDEYFCHYAMESDFDIWCDMELSLEIGHIGSTINYISKENTFYPSEEVKGIDESV